MEIRLTKGTKEIVPVDVVDASGAVSDLSGASPKYDLMKDDNTYLYNAVATTAVLMRIACLLDSSAAGPSGPWAAGHYRLFVRFTAGTELVRLGPIDVYLTEV